MENLCECGGVIRTKGMCNICYNRRYQKQYRQENAEKLRQKNKLYYQENAENIIQMEKQYRQENAEKIRRYQKLYQQKLKEGYVIKLLTRNTTLTSDDMRQYPELIQLKRAEILLKREIGK